MRRSPAEKIAEARERLRDVRGTTFQSERGMVWQRRTMLVITLAPVAALIFVIVQLWGWGVSARDLWIALAFYVISGLGITVGFHRLLTHKSFDASPNVRAAWAIAGSLAVQGSVIGWVATHRRHHAYSDEHGDPHSPHVDLEDGTRGMLRGLYHAHMGWFFQPDGSDYDTWTPDLKAEPKIAAIEANFPYLLAATFILPALVGGILSQSVIGAVTAFVWAGVMRVALLQHVTWAINSICHVYGTRPFASRDQSRNVIWLSLLSFGESWHNGHHAFPASARHGLRWWEFDVSWLTIRLMALLGIARNIKLPSPKQLERKRLPRRAPAG